MVEHLHHRRYLEYEKRLEEARLRHFQSHLTQFSMAMNNFQNISQVLENSIAQPQILKAEDRSAQIKELYRLKDNVEQNMDALLLSSGYFLFVGQSYRRDRIKNGINGVNGQAFLLADLRDNDEDLYQTLMDKYICVGLEIVDSIQRRLEEWEPEAIRHRDNDFYVTATGDKSGYTALNILDRMAHLFWIHFYRRLDMVHVSHVISEIWDRAENDPIIRQAQISNMLDGTDKGLFPEDKIDLSIFSKDEVEAIERKIAANQKHQREKPQGNAITTQDNVVPLFPQRNPG